MARCTVVIQMDHTVKKNRAKRERKMNRSVRLIVRTTPDEMNKITTRFSASTCQTLSEYYRAVLLNQSVTINHRNQSLDELMAELIRLRYDLNLIADNLNEAVKRLNTLQKTTELKAWFLLFETTRKMLLEKVEIIKQKIASINDKWLQ